KQLVKEAHDKDMKIVLDLGIESHEVITDEFIETTKWWIHESNIDGYKLNLDQGISTNIISELVTALKSEKEEFLLVGESIGIDNIAEFEAAGIDIFFNTVPYEGIQSFSVVDEAFSKVEKTWEQAQGFDNPSKVINFIDNLNTVRF